MKNIKIVLIVFALVFVSGFIYMKSQGSAPKTPFGASDKQKSGSVFTSIKDALSQSLSLKCEYTDEQGQKTTSYIKAGSVKIVMDNTSDESQQNNVLMRDKKMYMWSDKTKEGLMLTIEDTDLTPPPMPTGNTINNPEKTGGDQENFLAQIEKYKNSCKTAVISDTYFTVPTDVKFQNMDELRENMMKGFPQGKDANPMQIGLPSQEDLQKAYPEESIDNVESSDPGAGY